MRIDGTYGFAASGGRETLAIGAGYVGRPEQGGEWLTLLCVDQHGECRPIDFLTQGPAGGPGKLAAAGAVSLRFHGRFEALANRLRDVALYHRSGGHGAALARLDPDLARTLRSIFPPATEEEPASVATQPAPRRTG